MAKLFDFENSWCCLCCRFWQFFACFFVVSSVTRLHKRWYSVADWAHKRYMLFFRLNTKVSGVCENGKKRSNKIYTWNIKKLRNYFDSVCWQIVGSIFFSICLFFFYTCFWDACNNKKSSFMLSRSEWRKSWSQIQICETNIHQSKLKRAWHKF